MLPASVWHTYSLDCATPRVHFPIQLQTRALCAFSGRKLGRERQEGRTHLESPEVAGSVKPCPTLIVLRKKEEQSFQEHGAGKDLQSFLGAQGKAPTHTGNRNTSQAFQRIGSFFRKCKGCDTNQ